MTLAPTQDDHVCPPEHPHDATSNCYCGHKCRCIRCRAANARRTMTAKKLDGSGKSRISANVTLLDGREYTVRRSAPRGC